MLFEVVVGNNVCYSAVDVVVRDIHAFNNRLHCVIPTLALA